MSDSPPTPTAKALEGAVTDIASVGGLLTGPRRARVYVYVCYYGPVTRPEIQEALELPKTTVYDTVETLATEGVLTLDEGRPATVSAEALRLDADGTMVTPIILHAVAMQDVNDDVAHFVERHGVGTLAGAVRQAGLHYAGRITQRMAGDPLGINPGEAILIVDALRPVIAAGRAHDPYFADLFPGVAEDVELPDVDVTAPTPAGT